MRKYESIVVFDPNLNENQLKDEIKKFQTVLDNNKAENVQVNPWGKKEIAYLVGKHRYGNYVAFNYQTENQQIVSTLSGLLRISDNVVKFQTHLINERSRKFKGNPRRKTAGGEESGDTVEAEF